MLFKLINAGATFKYAIICTFGHMLNTMITIYLDDMTIISKRPKKHLKELKEVLQRCQEYGVSLNPKNSRFYVTEGELLGHIVSKEGIELTQKE